MKNYEGGKGEPKMIFRKKKKLTESETFRKFLTSRWGSIFTHISTPADIHQRELEKAAQLIKEFEERCKKNNSNNDDNKL